jgi:phage tail-like protein
MEVDAKLRDQAHASFRFVVYIDQQAQAAFTECTLPAIEWEIEEIKEGGLNTFTHQLRGRRKAAKITLKKGVGKSDLLKWYLETLGGTFTRKPVTVELMELQNESPKVLMTWTITAAFPSKWSGPDLKSDANTVAIQSFELVGGEITVS